MRILKLLLVPASMAVSTFAFAAAGPAVDVTDVTGTISAQLPSINLVGVAVLALLVAIAAYKWVRRAL
jgi:hypothetical protein